MSSDADRQGGNPESGRSTHDVIHGHLNRLRDGAREVLQLFKRHAPELSEIREPPAPIPETAPAEEPSPLDLRIARHMGLVDRALLQMNDLNPSHRKWAELPPDARQHLEALGRTIQSIICAELTFWSAMLEAGPLERLAATEQAWIRRIVRLAGKIGVDEEHRQSLKFLQEWSAQEHG